MALSTYSNKRLGLSGYLLLLALISITLCACAKKQLVVDSTDSDGLPLPSAVAPPGQSRPTDARMAASQSLIQDGYRLLQNKDYDGAIRILERAVGINPNDGPGYFYLAEAWLAKKDFNRAARLNELAILYLRENPEWSRQALNQKRQIEQEKANNGHHW